MPEPVHRGESSPDDYTIAELHSIVTRKFANGDDYARGLLRARSFVKSSPSHDPLDET